jgi:hypothetical protein
MIGEATYIACRHKQQLLPSTKQELPAWIYVRGKVQFKSMCCLEGIECTRHTAVPGNNTMTKDRGPWNYILNISLLKFKFEAGQLSKIRHWAKNKHFIAGLFILASTVSDITLGIRSMRYLLKAFFLHRSV